MINLIWEIPLAIGLIYMVAMFLINSGERLSKKFRIVKIERSGIVHWRIHNRFLFIWFHWDCADEYWDGEYNDYEKAADVYEGLVSRSKTIVKQN